VEGDKQKKPSLARSAAKMADVERRSLVEVAEMVVRAPFTREKADPTWTAKTPKPMGSDFSGFSGFSRGAGSFSTLEYGGLGNAHRDP
jgi:hypothetical protein